MPTWMILPCSYETNELKPQSVQTPFASVELSTCRSSVRRAILRKVKTQSRQIPGFTSGAASRPMPGPLPQSPGPTGEDATMRQPGKKGGALCFGICTPFVKSTFSKVSCMWPSYTTLHFLGEWNPAISWRACLTDFLLYTQAQSNVINPSRERGASHGKQAGLAVRCKALSEAAHLAAQFYNFSSAAQLLIAELSASASDELHAPAQNVLSASHRCKYPVGHCRLVHLGTDAHMENEGEGTSNP